MLNASACSEERTGSVCEFVDLLIPGILAQLVFENHSDSLLQRFRLRFQTPIWFRKPHRLARRRSNILNRYKATTSHESPSNEGA